MDCDIDAHTDGATSWIVSIQFILEERWHKRYYGLVAHCQLKKTLDFADLGFVWLLAFEGFLGT